MKKNTVRNYFLNLTLLLSLFACENETILDTVPDTEPEIYRIPVVVHILHKGEALGVGYNLPEERIRRQLEILNEDFRKKEGTRGFNTHVNGADTRIEFFLATKAPDGSVTNGVTRIDVTTVDNPISIGDRFSYNAFYVYWNSEQYVNIWVEPINEFTNLLLGSATGPTTDLPGHETFTPGEPEHPEGIVITSAHFGESDIVSDYNLGRTLTHEMGHYLGLMHIWGSGDCATNDYCEDTPPVSKHTQGCPSTPPPACNGQVAMIENYMDWTSDACMNIFTHDQVYRMHYVLKNSERRKSLLISPALPTK